MNAKTSDLEAKAPAQSPGSEGKALTRGVSFSPGTLFDDAKNYGASQKPAIGYSGVVCAALTEFLSARGALGSKTPAALSPEEAELIQQAKAQGIDLRAALAEALERKHLAVSTP